ncbi:MAG: hypothetical protein WA252_04905 [Candidatus Sulfotelmatobacter sp.]
MSGGWKIRWVLGTLPALVMAFSGLAHASATLLLEEPYGKLGFFTATGHAAVYLSGVCAETPLRLRPCEPGESGVVISRYDGVNGHDWLAIPLIPYLYAVDDADDIPLYADPRLVNFLRDQYRRKHLEDVAPDGANGATPGGNWYELVGTSYDRTVYAFKIETAPGRDAAFIKKYNSLPNHSRFRTVSRNCADFVKSVINFYYPRALHRSFVADVGIATPKQMAKALIKYGSRHPEVELSRYLIPQVPGVEARSEPVHGVVESFFRSKKYIVPSAVVSPIFAGCVAAVYVGTGASSFDPARHALVYSANRDLEKPLGSEDRRSYQLELNRLSGDSDSGLWSLMRSDKVRRLLRNATPDFDANGRPVLRIRKGAEILNVGISEGNIFSNAAGQTFAQELIEARLRAELKRGVPKASESDVTHDWNLLQKMLNKPENEVAATDRPIPVSQTRVGQTGNRP